MASIEERGESYRVVWRMDGRKQSTTWPTLKYAEEARAIVEGHRGKISADRVYIDMGVAEEADTSSVPTLAAWCDEWLPTRTRITPGTMAGYKQQLRDHILPTFGAKRLDCIASLAVGQWIAKLRERGAPNSTITRYFSLLHAALEAAVVERHIEVNPCRRTDFLRDQTADTDTGEHHAVYLTPAQYDLLRAAFSPAWWPLLDTLVETGARWSEATALSVAHIVAPEPKQKGKPKKAKVRIWRAWKRGGEGGGRYLGTPKGRQKRDLPIGTGLYKTLQPLMDGQPPAAFLFRTSTGSALEYGNFYKQVWRPALIRARRCPVHPPGDQARQVPDATGHCHDHGGTRANGQPCGARVVPGTNRCKDHQGPPAGAVSTCDCEDVLHVAPSPHDLRHTHAAWLFSDPRMTPLAVSRRLGHAQLATTSEIYGDLMPEAEDAAVDAISDARGASSKKPKRAKDKKKVKKKQGQPDQPDASND